MPSDKPVTKYRKDYTPTPYLIGSISLDVTLTEDFARIVAISEVKLNHEGVRAMAPFAVSTCARSTSGMQQRRYAGVAQPMCLNGRDDVELESVEINGNAVDPSTYQKTPKMLTLNSCPQEDFELKISTKIKPQENTLLEGLYKSGGNFCTQVCSLLSGCAVSSFHTMATVIVLMHLQCEAEGFRGITYFYDRPDVMSTYTVRINAEKEKYPVLLSNGNLIDSGDLPEDRHFTVWEDPFPKPCYLFALVAGNLAMAEDTFTTASGKDVMLRFYTEHKDIDKVQWAISSLKQSMKYATPSVEDHMSL